MKTALIVNGSPRKGNSAYLAGIVAEEAVKAGWRVEQVRLNTLEYKGCQACYRCKTKLARCAQEDDLTAVLEGMREADLLVLASPVYYGDVSAQLKAFIDRTYSFLRPDFKTRPDPSRLEPGKKLLFVLAQANPEWHEFDDIYHRYARSFRAYGYDQSRLIRAVGVAGARDAAADENLAARSREVARMLLR